MATNDPKTHFEPFKDAPRRSSSLDSSASHGSESASGAGASAGAGATGPTGNDKGPKGGFLWVRKHRLDKVRRGDEWVWQAGIAR